MLRSLTVFAVLGIVLTNGCAQESTDSDASAAEVPEAGPAIPQDPGPAPEGQWEPTTIEEDAAEDAATDEDVSDETETGDTATPADEATPADNAQPEDETASANQSSNESPTSGKDSVSLQLQTWDETAKLIASHRGKVVVVDFWSTSCLPCRREFPHLVELQKSLGDEIACVSVSLDYSGRKSRPPEFYRESVLEFLKQQNATIGNVLSTDDPDALQQRLKLPPIPLVWVFDRTGKKRMVFDNGDRNGEEFTYAADVVPFVESLVAEN